MCLVIMFGVLRIYTSKMDMFIIRKEKRTTLPCLPSWSGFTSSQGCDPELAEGQSLTDRLPWQCSAFPFLVSPDLEHQPGSVFLSFHRMTIENQTFTI